MPALSNAKRERFAQEIAAGKSATEAAQNAGYSARSAYMTGHRLMKNDEVAVRIEQLQERAAQRTDITLADLIRMAQEDREFARELSNPSAAGQSTERIAKLTGNWTERHEVDQHTTVSSEPLEDGESDWERDFGEAAH